MASVDDITKELKRISVALYYRKQRDKSKHEQKSVKLARISTYNTVQTKSMSNFLWKSLCQEHFILQTYRELSGWRWECRLFGIHAAEWFFSGRGVIHAAEAKGGSRKCHMPKAFVLLYKIIQHPKNIQYVRARQL